VYCDSRVVYWLPTDISIQWSAAYLANVSTAALSGIDHNRQLHMLKGKLKEAGSISLKGWRIATTNLTRMASILIGYLLNANEVCYQFANLYSIILNHFCFFLDGTIVHCGPLPP